MPPLIVLYQKRQNVDLSIFGDIAGNILNVASAMENAYDKVENI